VICQLSILLVSLHLDGQVYLTFGVRFGVDLADAALEEVCPAHVEEDGQLLIVGARWQSMKYFFFLSIPLSFLRLVIQSYAHVVSKRGTSVRKNASFHIFYISGMNETFFVARNRGKVYICTV